MSSKFKLIRWVKVKVGRQYIILEKLLGKICSIDILDWNYITKKKCKNNNSTVFQKLPNLVKIFICCRCYGVL